MKFLVQIICFVSLLACSKASTMPCPFNAACSCDTITLEASCINMATWPSLTAVGIYSSQISTLLISGTFTSIPADAMYYLTNVTQLVITRTTTSLAVSYSTSSFVGYYTWVTYKRFQFIKMTWPSYTVLDDIPGLEDLTLTGWIQGTVVANQFTSLKLTTLSLSGSEISIIQSGALQPIGPTLTKLDLSHNPLAALPSDTFNGLSKLAYLDLTDTGLSLLPTSALKPAQATLQYLYLNDNKIQILPTNGFYGFTKLAEIVLDGNPISIIEAGAFNDLLSVQSLLLSNLPELKFVDVLVTYGMPNVKSLKIIGCQKLELVDISDTDKIPISLQQVEITDSALVRGVDPKFGDWLQKYQYSQLIVADSQNFDCNIDIGWMAKFVLCFPQQIQLPETYCYSSKQLVADNLKSYSITCP